MKQEERVLELLRQMIAIDSETDTDKEVDMERYLQDLLSQMDHVVSGMIHLPDDGHHRSVVYGLIQGQTADTVIFLNHHDVVGTEPYGALWSEAFSPDTLREELLQGELREDVRQDLESGEWLVGRGSCDMKGGAAAQLAVFEDYARHPGNASLLYLSLPDEESYSAGMRLAISVLDELRGTYGLTYRFLIDCEPSEQENGRLVAYTGSVGKLLPVAVAQGKPVHIGKYGQGINPVGVMARLIAATEGDPALADSCGNEQTPPPAWIYLRDRKQRYDVSLPQRVAACANIMMYDKTPEDVMYALTHAARHAVSQSLKTASSLSMEVMTGAELLRQARAYPGFDVFYENLQNTSFVALQKGESTYIEETIRSIEETLDFMDRVEPVLVIAFAPPYYPAANSMRLQDRKFYHPVLDSLQTAADVTFRQYFNGISDCSYCCADPALNKTMIEENLLLWGKAYSFDFSALMAMKIPFLLLGPWGKDLHERTERVHIDSVSRTLPHILEQIVSCVGTLAGKKTGQA